MRLVALTALLLALSVPVAVADNTATVTQDGSARSGAAVAGPVAGVSSSGDVRVRMINRTGRGVPVAEVQPEDGVISVANSQGPTSVRSGDASLEQESSLFVGAAAEQGTLVS